MPFILNVFLVVAIVIIIFTQFVWNETSEFFKGGAKLGEILNNLSLNYLVSYMFYLVVFFPDRRNRKNVGVYVSTLINDIIANGNIVFNEIKKTTGIKSEVLSKEDFENMCNKINPKQRVDMIIKVINDPQHGPQFIYANWAQYMLYHIKQTKNAISKMFIYMPYIDTELIKIVNEIINSSYFYIAEQVLENIDNVANTDLNHFSKELYEYYLMIKRIETYKNKMEKKSFFDKLRKSTK